MNAVKELLENCLDAGARCVRITVANGGRHISIEDDGGGIHADDMGILCERFTTSKLRSFEDLQRVTSFGFRGEALSSVSYVARVTVSTRTAAATSLERNARAAALEVGHLSLRQADVVCDMATRPISGNQFEKLLAVVSTLWGKPASQHLFEFQLNVPGDAHRPPVGVWGALASSSYNVRGVNAFLLFINDRLVEHSALKRAVLEVYSRVLQKGVKPWVLLSLRIPPEAVDVNFHPMKRTVRFIEDDFIVKQVAEGLSEPLMRQERVFHPQPFRDENAGRPQRPQRVRTDASQTSLPVTEDHPWMLPVPNPMDRLSEITHGPIADLAEPGTEALTSLSALVLVGAVDADRAAFQADSDLVLVDVRRAFKAVLRRSLLCREGRLPVLQLEPTVPLHLLVCEASIPSLVGMAEALQSSMGICIRDKTLSALPRPLGDYFPRVQHLPGLMQRLADLGPNVDAVASALADFFSQWDEDYESVLRLVVSPILLRKKIPEADCHIQKITSLKSLYTVFERC
ncbi:MAG: hypothetical protein KVP17_004561 [Porospora cf. gigantea B]|uniref:uncharacterized protein n=1 Tax=Porospora cf. gigantea B TaxID=2853592 RepID=UPI003571ABE6|nr:MAG: hypothetical protein KVP17_004561 [Porospora cf. gigantea B]